MAGMRITRPDGTIVEIDKAMLKSLSPEQLAAMMSSLTTPASSSAVSSDPLPQQRPVRSPEEIWNSGKRERVGLFLANQYAVGMVLDTTDIHRDWTEMMTAKNYDLHLEKSHLTQYLTRLAEMGYLEKVKVPGRGVQWTILERLHQDYPQIPIEVIDKIITT